MIRTKETCITRSSLSSVSKVSIRGRAAFENGGTAMGHPHCGRRRQQAALCLPAPPVPVAVEQAALELGVAEAPAFQTHHSPR